VNPTVVILGVILLIAFWGYSHMGLRSHGQSHVPDELEEAIEGNLQVLADQIREAQRLDRMFRD
jgi:hypothetical protein